MSFLFNL